MNMNGSNTNSNKNQINNQEINQIAQLSCIELSDAEMEALAESLSQTIEHFSSIDALVQTTQAASLPVERKVTLDELRPDEPTPWSDTDLHMAAPDFEETYYFVPKVL
jgi:aspartyl/glutamyl-tRNA(Asn/Gln) amidotransferase C subunit